ncbi:unnamed protein product [Xylocopa violacea]|uniref:Translation initiation factor IF-3 n=1 Tax=Xylocopa violacea TaxID=135666 RepID=A0ABP1NGI4_XYLVO
MLHSIKIINLIFNKSNWFLIKNDSKISQCVKNNLLSQRMISVGTNCLMKYERDTEKPRPKTVRPTKIVLIYPNNSRIVTELESAEKIAKRKNFHLVNDDTVDTDGRSIYKLISLSNFCEHKSKDEKDSKIDKYKQKFKSTKLFIIKSKIYEHDLNTKIANINRVLKKNYFVKLIFNHQNKDQVNILKIIRDKVEGNILKVDNKKDSTVLSIVPLSDDQSNSLQTDSDTKSS